MKAKKLLKIWLLIVACFALAYQPLHSLSPLEYINNSTIKLGINTAWGGGIGYFSHMIDIKNVINRHDTGRNIQQSFYGALNGLKYNEIDWTYNPVQGGDYYGNGSLILLPKVNWGDAIYVKTKPNDWIWNNVQTNDIMEQWVTLRDDVAQIVYRYQYNGAGEYNVLPDGTRVPAIHDQEMPAMFFVYDLQNLVSRQLSSVG